MSTAHPPRQSSPQPAADDSIDLRHARGRGQSFNWLAAVNPNSPISPRKAATPTPSPPTVMQTTTPVRTANSGGSWGFSPESLSAMGSPIPIERGEVEENRGQADNNTPHPHHTTDGLGNSPVPQLIPPQPFQPTYTTTARRGETRNGTSPVNHLLSSCSSSQDGLPSPVAAADATSPFAPSVHHSYSSAIMQALSMSEGAALAEAAQKSLQSYAASGSDSATTRPGDALYQEGMRAKLAKQQWATVEKARQELLKAAKTRRECSFTPTLSPYAAQVQRPAALRPENRAQAEMLRKKQWLAMKRQESVERELEECTFRPLTLRAVNLEPAALQANSAVFDELYEDAQEKQHFAANVRPQVVEEMEKHVLYPQTSGTAMPPEKIAEVVDRLFAKGAVLVSASGAAQGRGGQSGTDGVPHQPELAPRTLQIVEAKEEAGERNPNVVDRLYSAHRGPSPEEVIRYQLEAQREETLRMVAKQEMEERRRALAMEHNRTLLVAKYRALSKRAATARGQVYKPDRTQSVVGLARASLDVLTSEEAEELLYVLERCTSECIGEAEFVERVLKSVVAAPATARHALLRCPPPPTSQQEAMRRDILAAPPSTEVALPAPLPKVQRERADPESLERAKQRREQRMAEYRQEKARRAASDPFNDEGVLDEDCTFQPAPRRRIPYECRPDVEVPVRPTRAFELRRARALGLPLPADKGTDGAQEGSDRAPTALTADTESQAAPEDASHGTARLLRFPEEDTTHGSHSRSASAGPASHAAASRRRHATRKQSQPTTYADLAEARACASHSPRTAAIQDNTAGSAEELSWATKVVHDRDQRSETTRTVPSCRVDPTAPPRAQSTGASSRTRSPPTTVTPSIAELAAAGGDAALHQLGRDLLLRQLREFQDGRRQRAVH